MMIRPVLLAAVLVAAGAILPNSAESHSLTVIRGTDSDTVNLHKAQKQKSHKGTESKSDEPSDLLMHSRFHKNKKWKAVAGDRFWLWNEEESRVIGCNLRPRIVIDRRPRHLIECSEKTLR